MSISKFKDVLEAGCNLIVSDVKSLPDLKALAQLAAKNKVNLTIKYKDIPTPDIKSIAMLGKGLVTFDLS